MEGDYIGMCVRLESCSLGEATRHASMKRVDLDSDHLRHGIDVLAQIEVVYPTGGMFGMKYWMRGERLPFVGRMEV